MTNRKKAVSVKTGKRRTVTIPLGETPAEKRQARVKLQKAQAALRRREATRLRRERRVERRTGR